MGSGAQLPLSDEERLFCVELAKHGSPSEAYQTAFGDHEQPSIKADKLLKRKSVQAFLKQAKQDGKTIAADIYKTQMLTGTSKEKRDAATAYLKNLGDGDKEKEAFEKWTEIMHKVGAQVIVPPSEHPTQISFESFIKGEAHIFLPLESKLRLLEMAGAPWNDRDPKAKISLIQQEALGREDRELVVLGGSGMGKSALGGMFGICEVMIPGRNVAVVAAIFKHVAHEFDYIVQGMKNLFPNGLWQSAFPVFKNVSQQKYQWYEFETLWKSSCRGYSVDNEEGVSLLGSGFDLVICGEGDLIPYNVYNRKILRAMDRRAMRTGPGYRTGRCVMFTTPSYGEGTASKIYQRTQEETDNSPELAAYPNRPWAESVWVKTGSVLENPSYDPAVYEARKRQLMKEDPDAFLEQYHGDIRKRSGLVLSEFARDRHIIEMPPVEKLKAMRFVIGIDPGSRFGAVLLGMDRDQKFYVLAEVYNERQTVADNVVAIKEECINVLGPIVGIKSNAPVEQFEHVKPLIDSYWVDKASEQKLELEEALDATLDFTQLDVWGTLSALREKLGQERLFIVETCEQWQKDALRYMYKSQKGLDSFTKTSDIRKQYDHLIDATRYGMHGLEQLGPLEAEAIPVSPDAQHKATIRKQIEDEAWARPLINNPFSLLEY